MPCGPRAVRAVGGRASHVSWSPRGDSNPLTYRLQIGCAAIALLGRYLYKLYHQMLTKWNIIDECYKKSSLVEQNRRNFPPSPTKFIKDNYSNLG